MGTTKDTTMDADKIAAGLSPLQASALDDCCRRGSTRTNDGGVVDALLSGLCSRLSDGISNGWLVRWDMNPSSREDGYINRYSPTPLGLAVRAVLQRGSA